ncbi:MAG: 3-keto-disaccharide hydrolase [Pirellulales bacterium]
MIDRLFIYRLSAFALLISALLRCAASQAADEIPKIYLPSGGDSKSVDNVPPEGFKALYNGRDLQGWQGIPGNPVELRAVPKEELTELQTLVDEDMAVHWRSNFGVLEYDGKGKHIQTIDQHGGYELIVEWKVTPGADSGIYLRGIPQIDILEATSTQPAPFQGSGGLSNNKIHPAKPRAKADKPTGEWNRFFIQIKGDRVTVRLNGQLVTDQVVLENFWEPEHPIASKGPIAIEAGKNKLYFKNIFLRALNPPVVKKAE